MGTGANKPDDIPDDVWDAAREVVFDIDCDWTLDGRRRGDFEEQQATILVARAIMAGMEKQREADARIADEWAFDEYELQQATAVGRGVDRAARQIAAAIRGGHQ